MAEKVVRMDVSIQTGLRSAIGDTPLVDLSAGFRGRVWGKLESFNPGGSAKDRTRSAMVAAASTRVPTKQCWR